jgi:hypothetical protein
MSDNCIDSKYLDDDLQASSKERSKCNVYEPLGLNANAVRAMIHSSVRVKDFAIGKIGASLELTMLVLTGRDHILVERKPD